ncbi:hypothetical protein [Paenisporosarcina antarctica]|uniref:Uncharacterized protein n=1 Tax=Paenisporosarcina antarctica TaxID=417367 RepID=A0A4P6ZWK5_9BACL|nr:hypothetical protein [Paenisporosarcina antarctica]QBP40762.1 hypothetical protein E2636_06345 [Paenisporosarcina antarctica]
MINYLILLLLALIVFPIVILFIKKIDLKTKLMFLVGGLLIALLGLLVQSTLSFYYALLIMIGLIFAGAVLLTKQLEKQKLEEVETHRSVSQPIPPVLEKPTTKAQVELELAPTTVTEVKNDDWLKPSKKEDQ